MSRSFNCIACISCWYIVYLGEENFPLRTIYIRVAPICSKMRWPALQKPLTPVHNRVVHISQRSKLLSIDKLISKHNKRSWRILFWIVSLILWRLVGIANSFDGLLNLTQGLLWLKNVLETIYQRRYSNSMLHGQLYKKTCLLNYND